MIQLNIQEWTTGTSLCRVLSDSRHESHSGTPNAVASPLPSHAATQVSVVVFGANFDNRFGWIYNVSYPDPHGSGSSGSVLGMRIRIQGARKLTKINKLISILSKMPLCLCGGYFLMTNYQHKVYFWSQNPTFFWRKILTRIRISLYPHCFGSFDPKAGSGSALKPMQIRNTDLKQWNF